LLWSSDKLVSGIRNQGSGISPEAKRLPDAFGRSKEFKF